MLFPLAAEIWEVIDRMKYAIVGHRQRFEDKVWTKRALSISAPQIGHPLSLFILAQPRNINTSHQYRGYRTILNPVITWRSSALYTDWEGCLSVPDVHCLVRRHWKVRVLYWDTDGQRMEKTYSGLLGRVLGK